MSPDRSCPLPRDAARASTRTSPSAGGSRRCGATPGLRRRIAALALVAGMPLAAGCAGTPAAQEPGAVPPDRLALIDDPSAAVPRDFAVDVLVVAGDRRPVGDRVHERPLRVTLSADGSVHVALDDEISGRTPPVRIRSVDRATVAAVWTEARALGLLDPALDAPPVHPASIRPGPEELVAVVDVRADGRHRTVVERADGPRRLAPDVAGFVRTLAELAWAVDRPDRAVRVVPRRYDLGADPHARYRPPTVDAARGDV